VRVAIYLPLLAAVVLGCSGPALARRLPPATATRLLVGAGVLSAVSTSFVLGLLAFTFVAQLAPVAALGHWSVHSLAAIDPVPRVTACVALIVLVVLAVVALRAATARAKALLAARVLCHRLGGQPGQLVVVDDDVEVFAVSAARGRIVASRALLQALSPVERRVVLAHEAAHLLHHHLSYRLAADLAAAVNPMLRPLASAVRYATERWADEAAADAVSDRRQVAMALARTSLRRQGLRRPAPWASVALSAAGSSVVARVEALLAPPPRQRPALVFALAVLMCVTLCAAAEARSDTERLFESLAIAGSVTGPPPQFVGRVP
jgi:hypothetical protein